MKLPLLAVLAGILLLAGASALDRLGYAILRGSMRLLSDVQMRALDNLRAS